MATINFLYRSVKEKANLQLRLLYRFDDIDFVVGASTKLEVSKNYWSKQHKKKSKDIIISNEQSRINSELKKIENHILNSFNQVNPDRINKEWLRTQLDFYYNPPQQAEALPKELIQYIEYYIEIKKNHVAKSTTEKSNVIKQLIMRYELLCKKTLLITDIDNNFKIDFESYCLTSIYSPNTIARAMRFIKTICKHAKSNGLEISYQLDSIKIKYVKVDSIHLAFDELEKIEKIKKIKLSDSLENAKDWLIISCYTGQRVSDFMRFKKEFIRYEKDEDGILRPLLEFTQQKTSKIMTIPLHSKVMEILNKRNGMFPSAISAQKYNDYIKLVCEIAKLTQMVNGSKRKEIEPKSGKFRNETGKFRKCDLVTSHIGRRSLASNFYGIMPTSLLCNMTGHSTEVLLRTYIGKSSSDLAIGTFKYF